MRSNPGYLLKSFLLYFQPIVEAALHIAQDDDQFSHKHSVSINWIDFINEGDTEANGPAYYYYKVINKLCLCLLNLSTNIFMTYLHEITNLRKNKLLFLIPKYSDTAAIQNQDTFFFLSEIYFDSSQPDLRLHTLFCKLKILQFVKQLIPETMS